MSDLLNWGNVQAPYSQEAEQAVLGAILMNGRLYTPISAFLKAADFFILRHRYIYEAMGAIISRSEPLDYLTLCQELKAQDRLNEIGGAAYITELTNNTPSSAHADTYGRLVLSFAARRALLVAADEIKALALDSSITVNQVLEQSQSKVISVQGVEFVPPEKTFFDDVKEYFALVEEIVYSKRQIIGIPTGFKELDTLLLGLNKGDFIVGAGRPGMGKSSLQLSAALNTLTDDPARVVGLFSMEMNRQSVVRRATAIKAEINLQTLQAGKLSPQEYKRFVATMGDLSKLNLCIDDRPGRTPKQIIEQVDKWLAKYRRLDLICVDYLQLMHGEGFKNGDNRVQEVTYISGQLKEIAMKYDVPVFALAQLSRAVESRQDKRPMLSDLRESGSIEQDADIVMFLYRDDYYNPATEFPNVTELIVAKHRNGPTDTVALWFEKTLTKYMSMVDRRIHTVNLNTYSNGSDHDDN